MVIGVPGGGRAGCAGAALISLSPVAGDTQDPPTPPSPSPSPWWHRDGPAAAQTRSAQSNPPVQVPHQRVTSQVRCPRPRWRRRQPAQDQSHTGVPMGDPAAIDRRSSAQFVHRTWPAQPRQLAPLRAEVRRWLAPLDLSGQTEEDLVLVVSEAASNCVEHAYPPADGRGHWRVDFLDRTPRGLHPDHRPRPVAHSVRTAHPTGQGNCDHATARRVRSDPPRRSGTRVLVRHPWPGDARDAVNLTPSDSW